GSLSLSALCYQEVYETIFNVASEMCEGKLVLVLEGGYSLSFIGKLAVTAVAKMSGAIYSIEDKVPMTKKRVKEQGEKVIKEVKQVQKAFWNV
ncbi:MAG: histone deacetylase, partial [Candidatus Bathyarchaeota archaeon]|nr:histone deacetylase [Candidatus Bathyarchaeota archaeon]